MFHNLTHYIVFILMYYCIKCTCSLTTYQLLNDHLLGNKYGGKSNANNFNEFTNYNNYKRDLNSVMNDVDSTQPEDIKSQLDATISDGNEVKNDIINLTNGQNDEVLDETKANKESSNNIPLLQNDGNKETGSGIPLISGNNFPQIPSTGGSNANKEGGGIPFLQGGNFQMPGGLGDLGQGLQQTPKLVWGGFFFVETPIPGGSMSNIANMASLMQNGQQMFPGGLPNQMVPIPGAG